MSSVLVEEHEFSDDELKTFYLSAGPKNGPLLIFVHGWPGIAETWKPQLSVFAAFGFHVVAPDMRGYGRSTATREASDYRLELIVSDMLKLLAHLQRKEAIWIGHDWGAAVVWALAAHHPEVCCPLQLQKNSSLTYKPRSAPASSTCVFPTTRLSTD
jgi:soluble epoxide hydrolase/lipid-phosphate phosphatase